MVKLTLTPFKGKLLKFLYILTRQRRFLSNAKLAELAGVTRRTIDSWLRYFSEPYTYKDYRLERKLSYFPHIVKKSLGLKVYTVFFHNPDWELAYTCPNKNFIGRLNDVERNCPVLAMECLVPVDRANDFKQIVELAPTYDLCSEVTCYETQPSFILYSPFHEVVDKKGEFHYDKNDSDKIQREISRFNASLCKDYTVEMHPVIRENPLIIPVLGENMFELRSSPEIWDAMKRRLGDDIWSFFEKGQRKSDSIGVAMVQRAKRVLRDSGLIAQMRVVYFPFEVGHNFLVWNILNCGSTHQLMELVESMLRHSILVNVRRIEDDLTLISYLLNGKAYQALFNILSEQKILKTMIYDYSQWQDLVTTTKYNVFDYTKMFVPEHSRWVLDIKHLQQDMQRVGNPKNV